MMNNEEDLLGELKTPETEAGYFKKLFSGIVDTGIVLLLWYLLYRFLPYDLQKNTIRAVHPTLVALLLLVLYRVVMMFGFNHTIGMLLFKIKLLTSDHQELTKTQQLTASFLLFMKEVKYFNAK
jgi:hypothetical protein